MLGGSLAILGAQDAAVAQTPLPEVTVHQPKPAVKPAAKPAAPVKKIAVRKPSPKPAVRQVARHVAPRAAPAVHVAAPVATPAPVETPEAAAARVFAAKTTALDKSRENILPRDGANATDLGQQTIAALPQGDNQPIEKVLVQLPGVSQDIASNGGYHVRNEHANVQFRINGVLLPDGVSGFGQVIDFVSSAISR